MDELPESVAAAELQPGEKLLWSGKPLPPRTGPLLLAALPISFFGLFFAGFAIFWIGAASGFRVPHPDLHNPRGLPFALFPLFGLPFLLAGLGMVASPFLMAATSGRTAARTVYAVTSRRVIVITGAAEKRVESFDGAQIGGELEKRERSDGYGDIVFTKLNPLAMLQATPVGGSNAAALALVRRGSRAPGLYGVPDVNSVERVILGAFTKNF